MDVALAKWMPRNGLVPTFLIKQGVVKNISGQQQAVPPPDNMASSNAKQM
jgi:hypothetical protein